jgi:hypothetical protein
VANLTGLPLQCLMMPGGMPSTQEWRSGAAASAPLAALTALTELVLDTPIASGRQIEAGPIDSSKRFWEGLATLTCLRKLHVHAFSGGALVLVRAVEQLTGLVFASVALRRDMITAEPLPMAPLLTRHTHLRRLHLSGFSILPGALPGADGSQAPALERYSAVACSTGSEGAAALVQHATSLSSMSQLSLTGKTASHCEVSELSQHLWGVTKLASLTLQCSRCAPPADVLGPALASLTELTYLALAYSFQPRDWEALAPHIRALACLVELDLRDDSGAVSTKMLRPLLVDSLVQSIAGLEALQTLRVLDDSIEGARACGCHLQNHPSLRLIDAQFRWKQHQQVEWKQALGDTAAICENVRARWPGTGDGDLTEED